MDALGGTASADIPLSIGGTGPPIGFGSPIFYDAFGFGQGTTLIGDLNADGRKDALFWPTWGNIGAVFYQNISGGLDAPVQLQATIYADGVGLGDLNGDGRTDIVLSGGPASCSIACGLAVFYQAANGTFPPDRDYPVSSSNPAKLAVGDLNGDGRDDVAVTAEGFAPNHRLSLRYQDANGNLGPEQVYDQFPVKYPVRPHIVDVTGDGRADLVVASGQLQIAVIKQTPLGTLDPNPAYYDVQTSYWPTFDTFDTGDLNGDGRNDVVVLDPGNHGNLNIYLQTSAGTLAAPVLLVPWPESPCGIEVADVNGDGLNDIIGEKMDWAVTHGEGDVMVIYQQRDHTFGPSHDLLFRTQSGGGCLESEALAVGDVTGDGMPDAVMNWTIEGVWLLPNNG